MQARQEILELLLQPLTISPAPKPSASPLSFATGVGPSATPVVSLGVGLDTEACEQEMRTQFENVKDMIMDKACSYKRGVATFMARRTMGYSGADLKNLVQEAGMIALRRSKLQSTSVSAADFVTALHSTNGSLSGVQVHHPYSSGETVGS